MGPITSKTLAEIKGMGFSSVTGPVNVRYACPKGYVEVGNEVIGDQTIYSEAPPTASAIPIECGDAIDMKPLHQLVAPLVLDLGRDEPRVRPGLVGGSFARFPTAFIIQARAPRAARASAAWGEFVVRVRRRHPALTSASSASSRYPAMRNESDPVEEKIHVAVDDGATARTWSRSRRRSRRVPRRRRLHRHVRRDRGPCAAHRSPWSASSSTPTP